MKIIHTGDIHIGAFRGGLPKEKAALRRSEITDGFRRLCIFARENGVAAVLIAGDLFDSASVLQSEKAAVLSAIENAKPTVFFYVSGNHDTDALDGQVLPDNMYRFDKNYGWASYEIGENVCVTGMDTKYFSDRTFAALSLRAEKTNIVLLHGDITSGTKESIPLAALQNKGVDYLALGHIHKPDVQTLRLDSRGVYRYCGCLEGRGFDEAGERGFFLLDIQGRSIREKFYTLSTRKVVEVRVDISACQNYYDVENAVLSASKDTDAKHVVKIVLCGGYTERLKKDVSLLEVRLSERFFAIRIVDESRLVPDGTLSENDRSERAEFIREVEKYEWDEKFRDEILEVGLKALAGEDIDL